jgi:hypothetical protein
LEWENLIFFAAWKANLRLLYIEYPWFPVTCFETVFVSHGLCKTNLCQNLRASRFKLFWGTRAPPPLAPAPKFSHPTTPLFCHLYACKKSFHHTPPPVKHPLLS